MPQNGAPRNLNTLYNLQHTTGVSISPSTPKNNPFIENNPIITERLSHFAPKYSITLHRR